jgi:hypothetical protein
MGGALVGCIVGLARCRPENRAGAERTAALLMSFLVGGLVGFAVCMIGLSSQLRYAGEAIVVVGNERRVEPPADPNGYLRVWLFGHPVYEGVGAREEMIAWQKRLNWFILVAFITGGASLALLVSSIPRQRTGRRT